MKLINGRVVGVCELNFMQIRQMYCLMKIYYSNVNIESFIEDLNEKQYVVLLEDCELNIWGFSTILNIEIEHEGEDVLAIFSGDTVTHENHRNSQELSNIFSYFLWESYKNNKDKRVFWYLISKGHKTYRYLPLFFNTFYPNYFTQTPLFEKGLIDRISKKRYPEIFDEESGIIKGGLDASSVKNPEEYKLSANLRNNHIGYFYQMNPGFFLGDELACLAEVNEVNANKVFLRTVCKVEELRDANKAVCL